MRTLIQRAPWAAQVDSKEWLTVQYAPLLIFAIAGAALAPLGPRVAILPAALLFGFSQIGGLCGAAHVSTIAALWHINHSLSRRAAACYTSAGLISATLVGAGLGSFGSLLPRSWNSYAFAVCAVLGAALLLRESGIAHFSIPEWKVQTNRNWAYEFGWLRASAMWGFHIGLGFWTVITYGGFWMLVAMLIVIGDSVFAAFAMATYWIGRCLPLWVVSPLALARNVDPRKLRPLFVPAQVVGLAWCVAIAITMCLL